MASMPPWHAAHRDAAIAVIGACTGIAALLLVFLGFLKSAGDSFPPGTPLEISAWYGRIAAVGLIPFVMSLAVMLAGYLWLFSPETIWLLKTWSWGFPAVSVVLMIYAAVAILHG
jgi:hypothetical protein